MSRAIIAKYVTPWKYRREQDERRVAALRQRDGDNCRRCRRPLRFDLPSGHDRAPTLLPIASVAGDTPAGLENLCLCHVRCNGEPADNTEEVLERVRLRA